MFIQIVVCCCSLSFMWLVRATMSVGRNTSNNNTYWFCVFGGNWPLTTRHACTHASQHVRKHDLDNLRPLHVRQRLLSVGRRPAHVTDIMMLVVSLCQAAKLPVVFRYSSCKLAGVGQNTICSNLMLMGLCRQTVICLLLLQDSPREATALYSNKLFGNIICVWLE